MGQCCMTRVEGVYEKNFTREDRIIIRNERLVPFFTVNLKRIETVLEVQNYDHRLNQTNLRKIFSELGLNPDVFTDPSCAEFNFFQSLLESDKLYTQRKIILGSVLTSSESIQTKAHIIQKYYDFSNNNLLELDEIEKLLDEIVYLSVKIIPMVAVATDEVNDNNLSEENYQKYYEFLMLSKEKFVEKYALKILDGVKSISFDDLASKFNNSQLSDLLSSDMVRMLLFDMSMKIKEYSYP